MNLRDGRFERSVRRQVHHTLRASPALRREHRRVRQTRRQEISPSLLRALVTVLLCVALFKLGERNATLDAMLSLLTIWCAGYAVHYANRLRFQLYGTPEILVLALQPIGDDAIFQHQWRGFVRLCLWVLADIAGALTVSFSFAQASPIQWLTAVPCALALWMSVISVATCFVRLRPGANFGALSSGLFLLVLTTVVGAFYLPDVAARLLDGASGPFYSVPPFGWISYVIRESVLGSALLPLLLLLPVALLVPALHHARKRLAANYQLFAADADVAEADDPADRAESDAASSLALPGPSAAPDAAAHPAAVDPEQVQFVATAWARPISPWPRPGLLERWIARWLSPRERDVAEFLTAGTTDWTLSLRRSSILAFAALLAAITLAPSGLWLSYVGLYFAATTGIPILGSPCVGLSMVQMAGTSFPAYVGLPLGFHEVSRVLLKIGVVRILAFAPVALVAGTVLGHLTAVGWNVGLLTGGKIVALLLCWQPIAAAFQFSLGTNDTRSSARRAFKLFALFGPLLLALVGATAGTLFAPLPAAVICLAVAALLSWSAFRLYARFYNRNSFDLMHGQAQ